MAEPQIQNVSDTAFMVAAYRAMETNRPDPLFRDPLAAKLIGDRGAEIVASLPRAFAGGWSVTIRTVIIDEFIQLALGRGVDTVLNLGAGLDTRPYRMDLPESLRWIEVDYSHMLALKEDRLADEKPRCKLERVRMDLTDRAARGRLVAEVASRARSVLVLTEGVVPYLTVDEVASLADELRAHDSIRFWIVDYFSREAIRFRERKGFTRHFQNAPFQFDPDDWFGFFFQHGWEVKTLKYIAEESKRLHRPMPFPRTWKALMMLRAAFMTRAQREASRRFAGYALLEPR